MSDPHPQAADVRPTLDWITTLRGAGAGNFGVVTSLTFQTLPPPPMTAFHLLWPAARAARVIEAWQAHAPDAPDELAASLLVTLSGTEEVPVVHVSGAMVGTRSDAAEALAGLVARAGDPVSTELHSGTHRETKRYLAQESGDPSAGGGVAAAEASPSSSGGSCRVTWSPRWWPASTAAGRRRRRGSWTSRPGPARTTESRRRRRPSPTAGSASC